MTTKSKLNFRASLLQAGKSATGIEIPPKFVEALGAGKRPPVSVTLNGYTYRSTIAVMGGRYMVSVSAAVRAAARVAAGDQVSVGMELDLAPREVPVPPELQKALAKDAKAKAVFGQLSYSKKRLYTEPIDRSKTADTRQRNVDKAMVALTKGVQ
jgi:hypothetical protein